jgi:hypothetical protein
MARRGKWPKGSKYPARRGRRRGPGAGTGSVVVILLLIVAAVLLIPRIQSSFRRGTDARLPSGAQALADSTDAATRRGDWDAALVHAVELGRVAPKLSGAQRKLSLALHNYGTGVRTVDGTPRAARRTSIDKIEYEIRALMAADSARALAANEEEWVAAAEVYAKTLEYLGLPLDALGIYNQILQRRPDHQAAQVRAHWLREHLRNPLLPDQL